jgi:hypothetical protein
MPSTIATRAAARTLPAFWLCAAALGCPAHNDSSAAPRASNDAAHAAAAEPAQAAAGAGARVVLLPPGHDPINVRVEIADDEAERRQGLMYRKQLDPDAGMLFLFEAPQHLTFWMHNTYVPLDMIFIEPSLRILGVVENAEPLTDSSRDVPGNSQYVLEVNAGFSRANGLTAGTLVRFEGVDGASPAGR